MPRTGNDTAAPSNGTADFAYALQGGVQAQLITMPENGWITDVKFDVRSDTATTVTYRVGIYDSALSRIYNGATSTFNSTSYSFRGPSGLEIKVGSGDNVWIAWLTQNNSAEAARIYAPTWVSGTRRSQSAGTTTLPNPLGGSTAPGTYAAYFDYIANVAPSTPTWRTPSSNGTTVAQTPTIEGNLLQGADAAYDTIDDYQLQVYVLGTGTTVVDQTYATTATERTNGYFSRSVTGLSGGVTYGAKFRTRDSFGVWSVWSAERTFITAQGSNPPTPVSPLGKINAISGYNYVATHTHPTALSANAAQVLVTNAAGSQLYDSGTVVVSVAPGSNISVAEWHTNLAWGTSYQWRMRVRDTANNWGGYTALNAFSTDAAPDAPTNLSPANNQVTSSATFTANVSDPDGDPVSLAQIEIALVSTGALVTGYPASMTVNAGAGTATYTAPGAGSGSLTLGTAYKWRARANDGLGPGYGAWSEYAFFTYAAVPSVGMIAPSGNRSNLIAQPSAEYDTTDLSAYWTATGAVSRIEDDDAPYGTWSWEANGTGEIRLDTTDFITIDATKAHAFFVWAKLVSGTPTSSFQVLCYNSSNTLVGTIHPNSLAELSADATAAQWTRYGGIVSQIGGTAVAFPATTAKVKLRLIGVSTATTGAVRFDAFSMSQLPFNPATSQERLDAQNWLGYADGDYEGFGVGGYEWVGVPGDSASQVLAILDAPTGASVVINYSHPTSSAKSNDRMIIEEWRNNDWEEIYDSNPTWATNNSNRTIIPLPANTIANENRYRLKVMARDAIAIEGDSGWVEFDTYYVGPPQLDVTIAEALPAKAQNRLVWTASTLSDVDFAGIEVQRIDLSGEEDTQIIGVITDPSATEFIDHYPASGREYRYRVRQLKVVGIDQVGGFWATSDITCDYYPYSFLKDTANPDLFSAFETEASRLVGYSEDAPVGILSPWGAARPTVLSRWRLRIRTGEVAAAFFTDAGIELTDFLDADTRFDRAAAILKRRQTIAILTPAPEPIKVFAAIIGEARTTFPYPPSVRGVEFGWQEVSWSEDYYERAGLE